MITLKEKIGYGFGDMASSMFWKIFSMYLLFFYTDVFGLAPAIVGTMFLITRIWDSFFDPVIGVAADRTHSRWGKFRPYLLYTSVPFGMIGVLTFTTPNVGESQKLIYAYVTYTLMMMVYSVINVPYASLLGVMSPNSKDRNTLSSYRMFFAYLGSFVALMLIEPLVAFFSKSIDVQHSWQYAVAVIAVLCVILFLACFFLTRERVQPLESENHSLKNDVSDLCKNLPWWILLASGIMVLIFNSVRDGAAIYYFRYFVMTESNLTVPVMEVTLTYSSLYLMLGQLANMVGVALAAPIANRIGKKKTYIMAMSFATVLSVVFYWLSKEQLMLIFIFQTLISICAGSVFPLLWSMYADIADYSELRSGRRATGLIFSSSSMSQKLGWTFGGALTGWLLGYFGFQANTLQSDHTVMGIKMMLSILPAVGSLFSVIFISIYPLSERKVIQITQALEVKRKKSL